METKFNYNFDQAVGAMNKALYVYRMNQFKPKVKPETVERLRRKLAEAAAVVGSWYTDGNR